MFRIYFNFANIAMYAIDAVPFDNSLACVCVAEQIGYPARGYQFFVENLGHTFSNSGNKWALFDAPGGLL